jgi:hypothetical protein
MSLFFRRKKSDERSNAALELTLQARAILDADDDTVVSVGQHDCDGPGCGGPRTLVLVLRPGHPTKAVRIEKPIESVTRADLSAALSVFGALAPAANVHSRTR